MSKGGRARKLSSSASAALGQALDLKVIAEGVETDAQVRFLAKHRRRAKRG